MQNIKSLIITLYEPAKIYLGQKNLGHSNLIVSGVKLSPPRFPLWTTCADILINSTKNEFVGVCYPVNDGAEIVDFFSKRLDSRVARYVDSAKSEGATPYIRNNLTPDHFEIRWSSTEADSIEVAQLSSDYWYYEELSGKYNFVAFGLTDIDEILLEYNLQFPTDINLEPFQPVFA